MAIATSLHVAVPAQAAEPEQRISLSIPATTVTMRPDRKDLTVGTMRLFVTCQRKSGDDSMNCLDFTINGRAIEYRPATGHGPATFEQEYSTDAEPGKFSLPVLSIGFSAAAEAYVCIAIGATLAQVPKQMDAYYFTGQDRYAVLTWCSVDTIPAWGWDNSRVTNNRAATFEEFRARLEAPINLAMTDRPLSVNQ
jgi:hypothetical protein